MKDKMKKTLTCPYCRSFSIKLKDTFLGLKGEESTIATFTCKCCKNIVHFKYNSIWEEWFPENT